MIGGRRPPEDEGHFALHPRHELLFRAALGDDERAVAAYRTWSRGLDLRQIDVASQRMVARLVDNLEQLGVDDDPLLEQCRRVTRFTWLKSQFLIGQCEPLVTALTEAGIPAMLLKGAAVVHHTGGAVALRPMDDIDLAVPFRSAHAAAEVASRSGFVAEGPPRTPGELAALVAGFRSIDAANRVGALVDLHWHVLPGSIHPDADREFWEAAEAATLGRVACRATSREDTLLHVVAHAARPEADPTLRWAGDLVALVRSAPPDGFDWDRVVAQARRHRLALQTADALRVVQRVVGLPVPPDTLAELRRSRVPWTERVEATPRRGPDGTRRLPSPTEQLVDAYQVFVRRKVAPGRRPTPGDGARFLAEWWDLPSARQVPAHALFVAAGRPWRTVERLGLRGAGRGASDPPAVAVGAELGFAVGGNGHHLLGRGWSFPETHGTWTIGREAAVRMQLTGSTEWGLTTHCTVVPFLAPGRGWLSVDVIANGTHRARWRFMGQGWQPEVRSLDLDATTLGPTGRLELRFLIDRPLAPDAAGYDTCDRPVGLSLHAIRVEATAGR